MRETHLTGFQVLTAFTCFLGGFLTFVVGVINVNDTERVLFHWQPARNVIAFCDEVLQPAKTPNAPILPSQLQGHLDALDRALPGALWVVRARPICLVAAGVLMMWAGRR